MVRPAMEKDLPAIESVYAAARAYMCANGNPHQWSDWGYPEHELLVVDIKKRQLYVIVEGGTVHGVFAFVRGEDPTYAVIADGCWPNALPYATLHRVAGDGTVKGIFTQAFEFALSQADEIRVDTHHDNKTMQHVVEKHGFRRCGVIYLASGDPRIAYQYSKERKPTYENV